MRGTSARSAASERELIEAARGGDERAFQALVEPHRSELYAHCYRMLGSVHDAEDALQEALVRVWRGLSGFEIGRTLRPWLYKIATNACLDASARRARRGLPVGHGRALGAGEDPGEPLAESVWLEPCPDDALDLEPARESPAGRYERREAVELAFLAALQHLAPRQRAVLILRDVLGFTAGEVAQALETTSASVNSALQRARRTVDERRPERSQQATLRALGDERTRALVEAYVHAWETSDVDGLVALLTEDATLAMPPYPHWWRGRDTIGATLTSPGSPFFDAWRYVPATRANGQLAVAGYLWDEDTGSYRATGLDVLTLRETRIAAITAFATPEIFRRFGLPDELPR